MEATAAVQERMLRTREVGGADPGGLLLGNSIPLQTGLGDHPGAVTLPFLVVQQKPVPSWAPQSWILNSLTGTLRIPD